MAEFESDHCPVCNKIVDVNTNAEISDEMRQRFGDRIYVPGEDIDRIRLTESDEQQRHDIEALLAGEEN